MPFPIEEKLVIGVASSALFDLSESHQVYLDQGPDEYRAYQERQRDVVLGRGVAFSFIRRFLSINRCFPQQAPVEVVLFSRNSPETGLRVMRSIAHYGLDISRAVFMTGKSPFLQTYAKLSIVNFAAGFLLRRGRFHPARVRKASAFPSTGRCDGTHRHFS